MRKIYSQHIFIFPFVWDIITSEDSFKARKDLNTIHEILHPNELNENGLLTPFNFDIETTEHQPIESGGVLSYFNSYNEKKYFYDYTHDVLNLNGNEIIVDTKQYNAKLSEDAYYSIKIIGDECPLKLDLKDAIVNFYNSGIGIVAFFLENKLRYTFEEILKINEYGRRIYPQFLGGNPEKSLTSDTKWNFLPDSIEVKFNNENTISENFSHYNDLSKIKETDFMVPAHILKLLGNGFSGVKSIATQQNKVSIQPVIDDRMYTMCFVRDAEIFNELKKWNATDKQYNYSISKKWHRLLFVDDSQPSCKSNLMLPKLNDAATYDRWIDNCDENGASIGQLFGITRYSFIVLTPPGYFNDNILRHHFRHQYFQMVLLSNIQRGSIISFAGEVKSLSKRLTQKKISPIDIERISDLHKDYIIFLNRIFFREITAQEQGIELYENIKKSMKINEEAENLKAEITELNEFVRNREAHKLTWIASLYLPATLVASIICWFAPDIKTYEWQHFDSKKFIAMCVLTAITICFVFMHRLINKSILKLTSKL